MLTAMRDEAVDYLEKKTEAMKKMGIRTFPLSPKKALLQMRSSPVAPISGQPDCYVHSRTVGREAWLLGRVTETIVRHSADPVLVIRAS